jgi:hypothetical protein
MGILFSDPYNKKLDEYFVGYNYVAFAVLDRALTSTVVLSVRLGTPHTKGFGDIKNCAR